MASPRTQFYYAATEIDAALKGIERCIRRAEGAALVVGQPGTGKSLLLLKLAEQVRDDFDVALLTGASICTRRALWQSILAAIGEPYRGIDEADLRIAVVERVRGLAATGSGLVILVDEAHTLPTRLIEELRLLTNIPTPMPAVHIVLAGSLRLEEMLGAPRMASLAQRIAVRGYLESLDHTETVAYLRSQATAAGLAWDKLFDEGSDDAVYRVTEGVPRLINQVCDQALVLVAESSRRVTPADIAAAWREIQRLPAPSDLEEATASPAMDDEPMTAAFDDDFGGDFGGDGLGVIEFGAGDEPVRERHQPAESATADPWDGPDVELVFGPSSDPFEELFADEERVVERYVMTGPNDFRERRQVKSREGQSMGRLLASIGREMVEQPTLARQADAVATPLGEAFPSSDEADAPVSVSVTIVSEGEVDDLDMVVIEEDLDDLDRENPSPVLSVRPRDYRNLFTRLRRGDR
jgi:type II secretory pathway predicted ATPase ExeA